MPDTTANSPAPALVANGADLPPQQSTAGPMSSQAEAISAAAAAKPSPAPAPVPADHPVKVYTKNMKLGTIPATNLKPWLARGGMLAYPIVDPQGHAGYVPAKNYNKALEKGYKPFSGNAAVDEAKSQGFLRSAYEQTLAMIPGTYHAIMEPPRDDEEKSVAHNGASLVDPDGRAALLAYRVAVAPAEQQAREAMDPNKSGVERAGHALAAAIPIIGPWVASAAETAGQQAGVGNVRGAVGTGLGFGTASALSEMGKVKEAAKAATPAVVADKLADLRDSFTDSLQRKTQNLVGSGTRLTGRVVQKAVDKAADQAKARPQEVRDYFDEKQDALEHNRQIAEAGARKEALANGIKRSAQGIGEDLTQLQRDQRAKAHDMFQPIEDEMQGTAADPQQMEKIITDAENKLKGSDEHIKVFGDIRSKLDDLAEEPNPSTLGTASSDTIEKPAAMPQAEWDSIGKNLGYKNAKEAIKFVPGVFREVAVEHAPREVAPTPVEVAPVNTQNPFSYKNLQGFYTELGEDMASRGKFDDVYRAMKSARDAIGATMERMAERKDAANRKAIREAGGDSSAKPSIAKRLRVARKFYHSFMDTFHEPTGPSGSGSPVAQAFRAKDPANILGPFMGKAGERGVEMLAKFDPELARRVRATVRLQAEHDAIKALSKEKPVPDFPGKAGAPEVPLRRMKEDAVRAAAQKWGTLSGWDIKILLASAVFEPMIRALGFGGTSHGIMSGLGAEVGARLLAARLLERPAVVRWLSQPTEADLEVISKIPGADRVKITDAITDDAVAAARQNGKFVRVAPAVAKLIGPANTARIAMANRNTKPGNYEHVAVHGASGHRIGTNDGGKTWHDVRTGRLTHAGQQMVQ